MAFTSLSSSFDLRKITDISDFWGQALESSIPSYATS
jgi:hypothetical protein